jgi:hypothetical protein
VFLFAVASTHAAPTVCVTAQIDESFVLPDGSQHPGGELKLCVERQHSPVASLHQTRVDGMPVSMVLSSRETSEVASGSAPIMVFRRASDDRLVLVGYSYPRSNETIVYSFGNAHAVSAVQAPYFAETDDVVRIAAR